MIATSGGSIGIPALHEPAISPYHTIFSGKTNYQSKEINQIKFILPSDFKRSKICLLRQPFGDTGSMIHTKPRNSISPVCLAALDAICVALQPLSSVERKATITIPRIKGEIKAPRLNDNGPRLPPPGGGGHGRGGGGDGGRGGAGGYSFLFGGFLLLLFLAFLAHMKNQEKHSRE